MYGAEHGFLLHTVMVMGGWLVFLLICVAPFALVFLAYWIGVRRGRHLERGRSKNGDAHSDGAAGNA